MQALMKSLNELCDALPFQTSFYVKDLKTGARGDRFGSVAVPSASTRKISIMMAALAAVHAGKLTLDRVLYGGLDLLRRLRRRLAVEDHLDVVHVRKRLVRQRRHGAADTDDQSDPHHDHEYPLLHD